MCERGLECSTDSLCVSPACPVGMAGCACDANGGCLATFECVAGSNVCRLPANDQLPSCATGDSREGGCACNSDAQCDATQGFACSGATGGVCFVPSCVAGSAGCACAANNACATNLTCRDNSCVTNEGSLPELAPAPIGVVPRMTCTDDSRDGDNDGTPDCRDDTIDASDDEEVTVYVFSADDEELLAGALVIPAGGIEYETEDGGDRSFDEIEVEDVSRGPNRDSTDDNEVHSAVIDVTTDGQSEFEGEEFANRVRICLVPLEGTNERIRDTCLAYRIDDGDEWVCEDNDLSTDSLDGVLVWCGFTQHFTQFALVSGDAVENPTPIVTPGVVGGLNLLEIILIALAACCLIVCCCVLCICLVKRMGGSDDKKHTRTRYEEPPRQSSHHGSSSTYRQRDISSSSSTSSSDVVVAKQHYGSMRANRKANTYKSSAQLLDMSDDSSEQQRTGRVRANKPDMYQSTYLRRGGRDRDIGGISSSSSDDNQRDTSIVDMEIYSTMKRGDMDRSEEERGASVIDMEVWSSLQN